MVASILGAGLRLALAGAVAFGLGMAGTVATSAASGAELETILLPSRPPEAIDLAYPGRLEQLRQSLARGAGSEWDGEYSWGTGYESARLRFVQSIGYAYESSSCTTHYRSVGDLFLDGAGFAVQRQSGSTPGWITEQPQLVPVRWGERRYLVAPAQMGEFVQQINDGSEPRCGPQGNVFLRQGDEKIVVAGAPELPPPWQGLLREEPLDLRVVSVDLEVTYNARTRERTMKHTLTLDGGTDRGVVVGLLLKPKQVGGFYAYVQVTAVRAHDATAVHETKVWGPREGESPPTAPAHGGTHPERNEVVGPYPGVILTSGVLPAGIGSLHCAPDDSLRR